MFTFIKTMWRLLQENVQKLNKSYPYDLKKYSTCDFELKLALVSHCGFKQNKSMFNSNLGLRKFVQEKLILHVQVHTLVAQQPFCL